MPEVEVSDVEKSLSDPNGQFGADIIGTHMNACNRMPICLAGEKDINVPLRISPTCAAWISTKHNHGPRNQGAALDMLSKLGHIPVGVTDDPTGKGSEMESIARYLPSYTYCNHLDESFLVGTFRNFLPAK